MHGHVYRHVFRCTSERATLLACPHASMLAGQCARAWLDRLHDRGERSQAGPRVHARTHLALAHVCVDTCLHAHMHAHAHFHTYAHVGAVPRNVARACMPGACEPNLECMYTRLSHTYAMRKSCPTHALSGRNYRTRCSSCCSRTRCMRSVRSTRGAESAVPHRWCSRNSSGLWPERVFFSRADLALFLLLKRPDTPVRNKNKSAGCRGRDFGSSVLGMMPMHASPVGIKM